jgi:xanthine dehydrogenase YagT iron-sulfur-binding subunit
MADDGDERKADPDRRAPLPAVPPALSADRPALSPVTTPADPAHRPAPPPAAAPTALPADEPAPLYVATPSFPGARHPDAAEPPSGGLSRRDFLRGSAAAGALGTALLTGEAAATPPPVRREAGVELIGPGAVAMSWRINGRRREATLEPRVTLLDALRDHLDLTGAKRVCDRGTCGACTVLIDGKTAYACSVLAIEAQGRSIETVEGLGTPERLHPLQAAIVDHDGQQCGFCTPGFVVAAKALLDHNPAPSAADVRRALSGNFCRCGTYAGLLPAVLAAASAPAAPAAPAGEQGRRRPAGEGKGA